MQLPEHHIQIYVRNIDTGTVTGVQVHYNNLSTLKNHTTAQVDATYNWWGNANGRRGKRLGKRDGADDRYSPAQGAPRKLGSVGVDEHGACQPQAEAGVEAVGAHLATHRLRLAVERPLGRQERDVPQGRASDAGDEVREAVELGGMTGRVLGSCRGRHSSCPTHEASLQASSGVLYGPMVQLFSHAGSGFVTSQYQPVPEPKSEYP